MHCRYWLLGWALVGPGLVGGCGSGGALGPGRPIDRSGPQALLADYADALDRGEYAAMAACFDPAIRPWVIRALVARKRFDGARDLLLMRLDACGRHQVQATIRASSRRDLRVYERLFYPGPDRPGPRVVVVESASGPWLEFSDRSGGRASLEALETQLVGAAGRMRRIDCFVRTRDPEPAELAALLHRELGGSDRPTFPR